jgi:hypothetical protein
MTLFTCPVNVRKMGDSNRREHTLGNLVEAVTRRKRPLTMLSYVSYPVRIETRLLGSNLPYHPKAKDGYQFPSNSSL